MSETLHPSLRDLSDCGCCAGLTAETPAAAGNREGLDQIAYRVGDYGSFKRTMLAALSRSDRKPLHALTSRAEDDFSIALLDAWAVTADVLTYYQERLANESYLRTATEHGSLLHLARLIGYQLKPGMAASVKLSLTLEQAAGAPSAVEIPAGIKVQSVPGPGEKPQTFETIEATLARIEWNAMRPQTVMESPILKGALTQDGVREMYLRGTATQLAPGDTILIVGDERTLGPLAQPNKERWDVRTLTHVQTDAKRDWTWVKWEHGLGKAGVHPAHKNVRVYAFRQRAALFGHNAPDPQFITKGDGTALGSWSGFALDSVIDLDANYPRIVPGSWIALARPPDDADERGYVELYKADKVSFPSQAKFGLSGKVTRIHPDTTEHFSFFGLRDTIVFAQSERLEVASPPLTTRDDEAPSKPVPLDEQTLAPVEGTWITVERQVAPLPAGRILIVSGRRMRAKVALSAAPLTLSNDAGSQSKPLQPGDTLIVLSPPAITATGRVTWRLLHDDGLEGTLETAPIELLLTASRETDPTISEQVAVQSAEGNPTEILLQGKGLQNIFDRPSVTIAGNIALATHGETVEEIAGSGDATKPFQKFTLRQSPLTFLRAQTPTGMTSTLEVLVGDLLWRAVPSLLARGPQERVYVERLAEDGRTTIRFGDGLSGARLPSGQHNVRLKYRKGSGLAGLVKAGQLTQLLTRPLGLKEVTNPLPAEGADEAESLAGARRNAPQSVLTLERVVSLRDYEDFAAAYPGIAKALATWTWDGRRRGVLLTVAGPEGAAIAAGGDVAAGLLELLGNSGDPFVPVRVETYRPALFELAGSVEVHADYEQDKVIAAARQALRSRFSFAQRRFGQPVTLSEVIGVLHAVAGVAAVNVEHLQRTGVSQPIDPAPRLLAELPSGGPSGVAAELLLLAPGDLAQLRVAT